jgi:hypothetical protein
MAFGSDRSANFVIAAKDAATKPLGNVGKAMGKLRGASVTAFKAIGAAAAVAAAAITAFVADSIKGAIEDERSTILTNAALKARGFELDKLAPKIDEQIKEMARLGKTDDDVRAGLEIGSRYFKNQERLLKANSTAAAISAVTGKDMATVMGLIGKAANGQTRGLAALIGPIEKGASVTDILRQSNEKFLDTANALADSTSGKMLTAQIEFNEAMDEFGTQFLPIVNDAITWLTKEGMPAFQKILDEVGPVITDIAENYIGPLFDSVGELFGLFEKSDFNPFILALDGVKLVLDGIRLVIDLIVAGLKLIGIGKGSDNLKSLNEAAANAGYGGGSYVNPMNAGVRAPNTPIVSGYTSGYGMVPVKLEIGNKAQSELAYKYGQGVTTSTGTRNNGGR